jgi:hypothetical protein
MVGHMDWYHDTEAHLFDDVERAADEALEEVLEEDRLIHALETAQQPEEAA